MFKKNKTKNTLVDLLDGKSVNPEVGDIDKTSKLIGWFFDKSGLKVEMEGIHVGPVVSQFTFTLEGNTKIADFEGVDKKIAKALDVPSVRIEIPIPGTCLGGVEIKNKKAGIVALKDLLKDKHFKLDNKDLTIPLGVKVTGEFAYVDFASLPHLLVAGATSSGKTMFLNTLIISLICKFTPEELKFILVDPKRVDMTVYNGLPYLLTPVVEENKKTIDALKWTASEMDRRFKILAEAGKWNIAEYNKEAKEKMPFIFFIVDEAADIMVSEHGKEFEQEMIKIAQMGRAVGIHIILATSRPCDSVLPPMLRANIPARLAFSTASRVDSEIILDMAGAERLLGMGDALFSSAEISRPWRIKTPFVSDEEVERVVDYLREKNK